MPWLPWRSTKRCATSSPDRWPRSARRSGSPAARVKARGLALVPEGRQLFTALSVRDNLLLGYDAASPAADLSRDDGMTQSQLAEELDLGKVAVGGLLDRLERRFGDYGRDGMFVYHLRGIPLHQEYEIIEPLDRTADLRAVHQVNGCGHLLFPEKVQDEVLDVALPL